MTNENAGKSKDAGDRDTGEAFRAMVDSTVELLGAVKDDVEHAIDDLRRRGEDAAPEKTRERVRDAVSRAQATVNQARERIDFVPRREFDELREEVDALRRRVDELESGGE